METVYVIRGCYSTGKGGKPCGLANSKTTHTWSIVEQTAHEYLCQGYFVEIRNIMTGKTIEIFPNNYLHCFSDEFPFTAEAIL